MNSYEMAYRSKKVAKLSLTLKELGWTSEDVRKMTDEDWGMVSAIAECKPPSGDETKDAVIEALVDSERTVS